MEHAYIIYEIKRCEPETMYPGDPDCASPEDIDKWLANKFATFKVINTKIDFNSFEVIATRQNEVFVPNVPLASGFFSDTGNRFRANNFYRTDFWLVQNEV